jgi:hypothetical protein
MKPVMDFVLGRPEVDKVVKDNKDYFPPKDEDDEL